MELIDQEVRDARREWLQDKLRDQLNRSSWVERQVLDLKYEHRLTWRKRSEVYWLWRLACEFGELALALVGMHKHSPEWKLRQIASIAMNWLENREAVQRLKCR